MFLLSAPAMMCTVRPAAQLFSAGHMALPMALAMQLAVGASAPQTPPKAAAALEQRLIWNAAAQQLENNALPRRASFPAQLLRCSFCRPAIHDSAADLHWREFWTPRRPPSWMQPAQLFRAFFTKTLEVWYWYTCFL